MERLIRMVDRDVDAPFAARERLRRRARLRTEVLGVRHHRFGADEVRPRHVAVTVPARSVAESGTGGRLVSAVDLDLEVRQIALHRLFHVGRSTTRLGVEGVDRPRPLVAPDAVEHPARAAGKLAAVEVGRGLGVDTVLAAVAAPFFHEPRRDRNGLPTDRAPDEVAEDHQVSEAGTPSVVEYPVHDPGVVVRHGRHVEAHRHGRVFFRKRVDRIDVPDRHPGADLHVPPRFRKLERKVVPPRRELERHAAIGPADFDPVGADREDRTVKFFADERPLGQAQLQVAARMPRQHRAGDEDEVGGVQVGETQGMPPRCRLEAQIQILLHLHARPVVAQVAARFDDGLTVARETVGKVPPVEFFLVRGVSGRRHDFEVEHLIDVLRIGRGNLDVERHTRPRRDPPGAHPRPLAVRERQIVRLPHGFAGFGFRAEPVETRSRHGHVTAQILGADVEDDPPVFRDLFCREFPRPRGGLEREERVFADFRDDAHPGEAAPGAAPPARSIERRFLGAPPRTVPQYRVVELAAFGYRAVVNLERAVPDVHRVVVASRIEVTVSPIDAKVQMQNGTP